MFSFVFAICTLLSPAASLAQPVDPVAQFVNQHLKPLLKGREDLYSIQIKRGPKPIITLYSGSPTIWMGRYQITLDPELKTLPAGAPRLRSEWAQYQGTPLQRMTAELTLPLSGPDPGAKLRSLLRADALLHPMIAPPGKAAKLAPLQIEIAKQLRAFHDEALAKNEGTRALMLAATGFGKTVISALFLEELIRDQKPFKIVFVVQNNEILSDATLKFQNLLKINSREVRRFYGDADEGGLFENGAKLVAMSRTKMHRNLDKLREERKEYGGRVFYVFDEAHHLGKLEGEFNDILEALDKDLRPGDVLLGGTATPWHSDSDIIERIFHNNVATALITPEEKKKFIGQRQLIYLARLMLFRAIAEGYLSPIQSYKQVRYLESDTVPVLARAFLDDWDLKFEGLDITERYALMKKEIKVHVPFIKTVIREILGTIEHDANGKPLYMNRGIIFVPSIAHADVYAFLMNTYSPAGKDKILAKAYHSGMNQGIRDATMDWFRDEEKSKDDPKRTDRMEIKDKVHKYLVVIRTLGEGFDEPKVNHLVLAKPYSEEDQVGMRELLQNLGRGSRLSYAKKDFLISDFTGDMRRLIFEGLDKSLIQSFFIDGTENALDDAPEPLPAVIHLPDLSRIVKTEVIIDDSTFKLENFKSEAVAVPEGDLSQQPKPAEPPPAIEPPTVVTSPHQTVQEDEISLRNRFTQIPESRQRVTWDAFYAQPGSAYFLFGYKEEEARKKAVVNGISIHDLTDFQAGLSPKVNPFTEAEMALAVERGLRVPMHKKPLYKGFDVSGRVSPFMPVHFSALFREYKVNFAVFGGDRDATYFGYDFEADRWVMDLCWRFSEFSFADGREEMYAGGQKTAEEKRVEEYFKTHPALNTIAGLFRRLSWKEFLDRPGSAIFLFHPTEVKLADKAAAAKLSINDLRRMAQKKEGVIPVFSDTELSSLAERLFTTQLFLETGAAEFDGFDERFITSPFMPVHFLRLKVTLIDRGVRDQSILEALPTADAKIPALIPEFKFLAGLPELMDILRIDPFQYSDRYSKFMDEDKFSSTIDHEDHKALFRPLKWREFIHRRGSAYFLFKPNEFELINAAAQDQLSIFDIHQMVTGHRWLSEMPFTQAVLAVLRERLKNARLPDFSSKAELAKLSPFSAAHLLFIPLNFISPDRFSHRPMIDAITEEVNREGKTDGTSWEVARRLIPELPRSLTTAEEYHLNANWQFFLTRLRRSRAGSNLRDMPLVISAQEISPQTTETPDIHHKWTWAKLLLHPAGVQMLAQSHSNLRGQLPRLAEMRESLLAMMTGPADPPAEMTRPSSVYPDERNRAIMRKRVQAILKPMGLIGLTHPDLKSLIFHNKNLLSYEFTPLEATMALAQLDAQERRLIELRPALGEGSPFGLADLMQKPMLWQGYVRPKQNEKAQNFDHRTFGRRTVMEVYLSTRGIRLRDNDVRRNLDVQFAILGLPAMLNAKAIRNLQASTPLEGSCEERLTN